MGKLRIYETDDAWHMLDTTVAPEAAASIVKVEQNSVEFGSSTRTVSLAARSATSSMVFDGTSLVLAASPLVQSSLSFPLMTVTTLTSNANYTMTAAQLLGGYISDTSGTGAIAATLPTVADVVALIPNWVVGTAFRLVYMNPGNQTITLTTGATWTMVGTMTIATTKYREFIFIVASGTTGSCYALATGSY